MIIDRLFTLASALDMTEVDLRIKRGLSNRWIVRLDTGNGVYEEAVEDPDVGIEKLLATLNSMALERRKQLLAELEAFDAEIGTSSPTKGPAR